MENFEMNRFIFASACLSLLLVFAHIIGGGAQFHTPILASDLPEMLNPVVSILWHFATFALAINTIGLFLGAFHKDQRNLVWMVIAQYLAFTGLFLFYGMTRLGSITVWPQWIFFLAIVALALIGMSRKGYVAAEGEMTR